jgi:hypothetical protein
MAKTKPKEDNPEQSKRFMETAKELEADERLEAFEKAFKKVTKSQPKEPNHPKK